MQNEMETFVAVVEGGTFSAAARALAVPVSTVSRHVSRLEERLGVRLLNRTTRRVTPTAPGQSYFERCRRIVAESRDAEEEVRELHGAPRGLLRISAPPSGLRASLVEDLVTAFMARYPQIEVELVAESRYVDLVAEGFDLALRGGILRDSALTARRLLRMRTGLVAAPDYLERRGRPRRVADLARHDLLVQRAPGRQARWPLSPRGSLPVRGRLTTNDMAVARAAAVAGLGIAYLPLVLVDRELDSGALETVLPSSVGRDTDGLHLVHAQGRLLAAKVRAFIDFAVAFFTERQGV
ncbi:MAG TPA: LysR family transcriptional regulator [Kofleriaceae bacterium]|nr:LysR family transcriptional regulator [Kofleriaceae bacterium]